MAVQLQCRLVRLGNPGLSPGDTWSANQICFIVGAEVHITYSGDVHVRTVEWEVYKTDMRPFNVDFLLHMKQRSQLSD